jgi:Cu(I)/Ag(I) efflux system membrane fusion protein
MKTTKVLCIFLLVVGVIAPSILHAGTEEFDKTMHPILTEYLKIQEALAADKTDGVKSAAEQIVAFTDNVDAKTVTGEHAMHYKDLPVKIKKAAQELARGKEIAAMRETFKSLSRPMAMWGTMSKPQGIYVVYCAMAKGSWLQKGKEIRNPYHGHEMLRCGEIVGGEEYDQAAHKDHTKTH